MFDVALVGFGYWGRKLFAAASGVESGIVVRCVVDADRGALEKCPAWCHTYETLDDALNGEDGMVGVIIATPIHTHYALAVKCLRLGLDVFVEKPLCVNSTQLGVLEFVADTTSSKLYCDYTIAISDKIEALKDIVGSESILHVDFRWESSPRVTNDNVVHDLFPHIVSIATALSPGGVVVDDAQMVETGGAIVKVVAIMSVGGVPMSATASWLDSRKVRVVKILTATRVIEYDDSSDVAHITPYSIGVENGTVRHERRFPEEVYVVNRVEPLVKTLQYFVSGETLANNAEVTRSVIRAFESIVKKTR